MRICLAAGLFASLFALACLSSRPGGSAGATTVRSEDAALELTLPPGWSKTEGLNAQARLEVSNPAKQLYVIVLTDSRLDFDEMTLERYSEITRGFQLESMDGGEAIGPRTMKIGGHPAIQYELRGAVNGLNVVFLHTVVKTPRAFHQILAWAPRSRFSERRSALQEVIASFRERGVGTEGGVGLAAAPRAHPESAAASEGAFVLRTQEGDLELTIPGTWVERSDLNDKALLQAGDRRDELYVIVLKEAKVDFTDDMTLEMYSSNTRGRQLAALTGAAEEGPRELTVGGHRAIQYILRGAFQKTQLVFLHTVVESPTHYYQVVAWTLRSRWESARPILEEVTASLKEVRPRAEVTR